MSSPTILSPAAARATSQAFSPRRAAGSGGLSLCATWAVATHTWGQPWLAWALPGLLGGAALLAFALYRWLLPHVAHALADWSPRGRWLWLAGCGAVAYLLLRVLPLHAFPPPTRATLEVVATGEHHPAALASEVFVQELLTADGTPVPAREWLPEGDWELRDDSLWVSYRQQPARLRWEGAVTGPLTLRVMSHAYSGVLEYTWNGRTERVDLYAPETTVRELSLPVPAASRAAVSAWRAAFHVTHWLTLAAALLMLGLWRTASSVPVQEPRPLRGAGLLHALPTVAITSLWLLALFPGMMSSDSSDQWHQSLAGRDLADAHPVVHTLFIRYLQFLWASPAVVGITHILGLAALVAWGCVTLARAGVPRTGIALTAALMALAPVNGAMAITVWKDIPFSLCIVALSVLVFRAVTRPDEPWRWPFWTALVVLGALTLLFRHNGPPAVGGAFMALLLLRPRRFVPVLALLAATFVLAAGARAVAFRFYSVSRAPAGMPFVGYLGAHVSRGTPLEPDEQRLLAEIHPLDDGWHYNCFSNVPTVWDGRFSYAAINRHAPALPALLARLTLRNPEATFFHVKCSSSMLWKVAQGRDPLYALALWQPPGKPPITIDPIEKDVRPDPVLPGLGERLVRWTLRSMRPDMSWLLWRPALPLYLALLACAVACLRQRSWRHAVVLLPIALHTAALVLLTPAQDMRYQYPMFLVAMMFVPAWLAGLGPRATAGAPAR